MRSTKRSCSSKFYKAVCVKKKGNIKDLGLGEALHEAVLQALDQVRTRRMTTSTHMSPIRSKRLARCDLRPPFSVQFTVSPRLRFAPAVPRRLFPAKPS
jgi:hypothetical protein